MNKDTIKNKTPLIKINYEYENIKKYIYVKLEYFNITGSVKDRVAKYIIDKAINRGELKEGMTIVEATSGNTGIALSSYGKKLGYNVKIFMPNWVSKERVKIIKSFGAKIQTFSREDGGFIRCIKEAKKFAKENNGFYCNQFANKDNYLVHYNFTSQEFIEQLPEEIGGFVSGVGTGGTLMGVGTRLKEKYKIFKIIAIEPDKMPLLSQGKILGNHKIEGIGDDFMPDLVDKSKIDEIIEVNDFDSINMARLLSNKLGLGVGISAGANFLGAVLSQNNLKPIATIFVDDNKKYISTDLSKPIDKNKTFISNKIKLINYEII